MKLIPVALLALGVGSNLIFLSFAMNDPGFALEEDYYGRAERFDALTAERAASQALGWAVEVELSDEASARRLLVVVRDGEGAPIKGASVTVELRPVASASQVTQAHPRERTPGTYVAELTRARGGLWDVELTIEHQGKRYIDRVRRELPLSGALSSVGR